MTKISAKIVADSKNEFGDRITTMVVTFPRYILAELNTHRMLSKNSASSRAIPFEKMLKSVEENPFIPIAWMQDHKGMQGKHYFNEEHSSMLKIVWLEGRDNAVDRTKKLAFGIGVREVGKPDYNIELTKQICNRWLEPFMWHTVIITATEWENFFALRCPQFYLEEISITKEATKNSPPEWSEGKSKYFRSRKDALKWSIEQWGEDSNSVSIFKERFDDWKFWSNKGLADIHMMALAEAMWDAYNEGTPKLLKAGEWHIPYENEIKEMYNIDQSLLDIDNIPYAVKVGTIMAARISYTVVGTDLSEWGINKYKDKFTELSTANPLHASPFEHGAKSMNSDEYISGIRGDLQTSTGHTIEQINEEDSLIIESGVNKKMMGWSGNFRGFIQLRKMLPNENITN